jgi:hypothetical protein
VQERFQDIANGVPVVEVKEAPQKRAGLPLLSPNTYCLFAGYSIRFKPKWHLRSVSKIGKQY